MIYMLVSEHLKMRMQLFMEQVTEGKIYHFPVCSEFKKSTLDTCLQEWIVQKIKLLQEPTAGPWIKGLPTPALDLLPPFENEC